MTEKYYTGVGSRLTPRHILHKMELFGTAAAKKGYTLRSGGADGADTAFEIGANLANCWGINGKREIYLPWIAFNNRVNDDDIVLVDIDFRLKDQASNMVDEIHPAFWNLGVGGRSLHMRNCFQVLGQDLKTPSEFVICWTKNAKLVGGTATAIRLALKHKIKVYNLADTFDTVALEKIL